MKKGNKIITLILMFTMIFSLTACSKSIKLKVTFSDLTSVDIVSYPDGLENFVIQDNAIELTIKKDGDYPFVVKDDDGNEIDITVQYYNKHASVNNDGSTPITIQEE